VISPPVAPLAERRRQATMLEVSAAAADLFLARGVDATTVTDIAAAAGISARTFHRYFPAKAEALGPVLEEGLKRYLRGVAALPGKLGTEDLLDGLAAALTDTLTGPLSGRDPELLRLVVATPELLSVWLRMHEECALALTPLLSRRLPDGSDPLYARYLGAAVVTANRLAVEHWASNGGDIRDHLDRCLQLLRRVPGGG
jgi:AcrR family transcriptional regulator